MSHVQHRGRRGSRPTPAELDAARDLLTRAGYTVKRKRGGPVEGAATQHRPDRRVRGGSLAHRDLGGTLNPMAGSSIARPPSIGSPVPNLGPLPRAGGAPPPAAGPKQDNPAVDAVQMLGSVNAMKKLFNTNSNHATGNNNNNNTSNDSFRRGGHVGSARRW